MDFDKFDSAMPDDFNDIVSDALVSAKYKLYLLITLLFFIITSDVFVNRVLISFDKAVSGKCATNWGTFIQGMFLCFGCILIDTMIRQKII